MTEVKITKGYKEIEKGIYEFDMICSDKNRMIKMEEFKKFKDVNAEIILGTWEAQIYQFLRDNKEWVFTAEAIIEKVFDDFHDLETSKVEKDLHKMVKEDKIKGAYWNGHYYYYYE